MDGGTGGGAAPWIGGVSAAVAAGGAVGVKLIPMAYRARGYAALGGEWMAVAAVTAAAFLAGYRWVRRRCGG